MTARPQLPHAEGARGKADLPFYGGWPVPIQPKGWLLLVAATVSAFLALLLAPAWLLPGVLSILPAIVFTGLPLAALSAVSGGRAGALFRPYGLKAFGQSVLFGLASIAASLAAALAVNNIAPLSPNPVENTLATIGNLDLVLFLIRTFIQLIGEEVVTVLPLLAVMWVCHARLGLSRRLSLMIGVVVSTAWFAAMHLPTYDWNVLQCFAVIGVSRLILTGSYLLTRNLSVSAGAHIIDDWSIFAVSFAGSHLPVGV